MTNRSPVEKLADQIAARPDAPDKALFDGIVEWIGITLAITLSKAERAAWTEARLPSPIARPIIVAAMRAALTTVEEREGLL